MIEAEGGFAPRSQGDWPKMLVSAAGPGVTDAGLGVTSSGDGVAWWALASAAAAPVVLIAAWLISGSLQPPTYRPLQQTISTLAGPSATHRWIMTAGLLAVGGCYVLTGMGLTGILGAGRVLLIVAGVAAVGLASSPVPAHGSTPRHLAWTVIGAVVMTVWPVFACYRAPPHVPVLSLRITVIATAVFAVLLLWTIVEAELGDRLGLAERLSTSVQICWPLVVAVALKRRRHAGQRRTASIDRERTVARVHRQDSS